MHTQLQMLLLINEKKVKSETAATTTILGLSEAHRSQTDAPFHSQNPVKPLAQNTLKVNKTTRG